MGVYPDIKDSQIDIDKASIWHESVRLMSNLCCWLAYQDCNAIDVYAQRYILSVHGASGCEQNFPNTCIQMLFIFLHSMCTPVGFCIQVA